MKLSVWGSFTILSFKTLIALLIAPKLVTLTASRDDAIYHVKETKDIVDSTATIAITTISSTNVNPCLFINGEINDII
jgi:hypothetical protein